jgi:hypothetical protein
MTSVVANSIYALREGLEATPRDGDQTATYWMNVANTGNFEQRVSAFIVLLKQGYSVDVSLRRRVPDAVVD